MSDTHEEQLLNELLAGVAREDAALDAHHLEARVVEAWDGSEVQAMVRLKPDTTYYRIGAIGVAAAILLAIGLPRLMTSSPRATEVVIMPNDTPGTEARIRRDVKVAPAAKASTPNSLATAAHTEPAAEPAPLRPSIVVSPLPESTIDSPIRVCPARTPCRAGADWFVSNCPRAAAACVARPSAIALRTAQRAGGSGCPAW